MIISEYLSSVCLQRSTSNGGNGDGGNGNNVQNYNAGSSNRYDSGNDGDENYDEGYENYDEADANYDEDQNEKDDGSAQNNANGGNADQDASDLQTSGSDQTQDIVVTSMADGMDPYEAFDISQCDTYQDLWAWDVMMSCGNGGTEACTW